MVSPAYIIPKKSKGKFRVILDSTVKDADGFALGVNAWIAYENYGAVLMDSIEEVVRAAQAFREQHPEEPTVAMAVDWTAWFHQLPLSLRTAGEMWTRLGDRSALQLMLSMGSASSPMFACLVSTAFTRRMQERITLDGLLPIAAQRVFVDDQWVQSTAPHAGWVTARVMSESERLGFRISRSKAQGDTPSSRLRFLGFDVDLDKGRLELPAATRADVLRRVQGAVAARGVLGGRRGLEVFLGKLGHASSAVFCIRPFLRPLFGLLRRTKESGTATVRLNAQCRDCLRVIEAALASSEGRSFPRRFDSHLDWTVSTDACTTGFGAVASQGARTMRLWGSWPATLRPHDIPYAEAAAAVIALRHWGHTFRGAIVRLRLDNKPVAEAFRRGLTHSPRLTRLMQPAFVTMAALDFSVYTQAVAGSANAEADGLSRLSSRTS